LIEILVVTLAYNEAVGIAENSHKLLELFCPIGKKVELIVVNDGSIDD
jgi:glycosyltransferase involved in cell wall biosynthesis